MYVNRYEDRERSARMEMKRHATWLKQMRSELGLASNTGGGTGGSDIRNIIHSNEGVSKGVIAAPGKVDGFEDDQSHFDDLKLNDILSEIKTNDEGERDATDILN